jgi:methyltransferase-like protein 6
LPEVQPLNLHEATASDSNDAWEGLFHSHQRGQLYKPRKYLFKEFESIFKDSYKLLEIGCGYGSSLYALLDHLPPSTHYYATDQSQKALAILAGNVKFKNDCVIPLLWDFTSEPGAEVLNSHPDTVLAIFALSALPQSFHAQVVQHIKSIFLANPNQSGYVAFRDYGLYDMTMFRHRQRIDEFTFVRADHTYCYYFTIDYLRHLFEEHGFRVKELRYATVFNVNKKEHKTMRRVFIHGVFQLAETT